MSDQKKKSDKKSDTTPPAEKSEEMSVKEMFMELSRQISESREDVKRLDISVNERFDMQNQAVQVARDDAKFVMSMMRQMQSDIEKEKDVINSKKLGSNESAGSEEDSIPDAMNLLDSDVPESGRMSKRDADSRGRRTATTRANMEAVQATVGSNVQSTIQVPPFDKRLKRTTPDAIMWFVREWRDYQIKYKVPVNPVTVVEHHILRQMKDTNSITESQIRSCTPEQFCDWLSEELKMSSKLMFFNTFAESLSYLDELKWSNVVPATHETFWNGLLLRAERANEHFNFIYTSNQPVKMYDEHGNVMKDRDGDDRYYENNIPKVSGSKGLAKVFFGLIENEYNEIIKTSIKDLKKYDHFKDFIKDYMTESRKLFKIAKGVMNNVPYASKDFSPHKHARHVERSSTSKEKTHGSYNSKSSEDRREYVRARFQPRGARDAINHLREAPVLTESESSVVYDHDNPDDSKSEADYGRQSDSDDESDAHDGSEDDASPVIPVELLNAMDIPAVTRDFENQDRVRGCIYHTLFDKCVKGPKCANAGGHNPEGDKRCAEWIIQKLAQKDRKSSDAPRKMFSQKRA